MSSATDNTNLRHELVERFRKSISELREEWVKKMSEKKLSGGLSQEEIERESTRIYDTCLICLETGTYEKAEEYARQIAQRGVLSGMSPEQVLGGMLTLRDVYGRALFKWYQNDIKRLYASLEIYEPVANKILSIVAIAFLAEREKVVLQQQEAIMELSTPVLQIREGLLLLPLIGIIDTKRARQITESLLRKIRDNRAKVVVIDITGVATVDSKVANHLIQTAEAARLMGAQVIFTGVSSEIAQTVVTIGVDLSRLNTMGDIQGGMDAADRLLGYTTIKKETK